MGSAAAMMLAKFPRFPLTFGPTPIEKLARLSAHLGGAVDIYAKREDCNSGLAFGGNKIRKLEYIVPDAIAAGADTLVTIGGVQSNHTRQVAAVAAKLGMKCRLVQERWVDWDDPVNDRVGNILLSRIMGADVRLDRHSFVFNEKGECLARRPASTSGFAARGKKPCVRSRTPVAPPTASLRVHPTIRSEDSASPTGPSRWRSRSGSSASSSTRSSSAR